MEHQPRSAQAGEIAFRRRLVAQQTGGDASLPDELEAAALEQILHQRMAQTQAHLERLRAKGYVLSPYLELGAERGQRTLVAENRLGMRGASLDISWDMQRSMPYYAERFGFEHLPLRLCGDAYQLPFADNSLPLVFCYQTLHHFPDPTPVIAEIHRVLAPGGIFFFSDEPYQKRLHLPLYKAESMYSEKARKAPKWRKLLDYFLAEPVCNETDFGIVENDDIPLGTWEKALQIFDQHELHLHALKVLRGRSDSLTPGALLARWVGGEVTGIARKGGTLPMGFDPIEMCLAAPWEAGCPPLRPHAGQWQSHHGSLYPVHDGVALLLPEQQRRELYPELADD